MGDLAVLGAEKTRSRGRRAAPPENAFSPAQLDAIQ
jgi:hypothetical protein